MSLDHTALDYIAEPLRQHAVLLSTLQVDPHNARRHSEQNLAAIRGSLQQFGQRRPAVVQRATGRILAGNGMYAAAKQLGWTHLAVLLVDDDAEAAELYAIADNRTAELATWDDAVLADVLQGLEAPNPELEKMLSDLAADQGLGDQHDNPPAVEKSLPDLPTTAWCLIGIPLHRFGEIQAALEQIGALPDVFCETCCTDEFPK